MTQFSPEKIFPKESVVGRELIKAYVANPIMDIPIPSENPIAFLPEVELPYQWETVYPSIITSDSSKLLALNLQVPIIIDKDDKKALFKALKNAGFDGKVRGSYTTSLNCAIESKYISPNKSFSFYSTTNPSLSLEYPENIGGTATRNDTMGIDVKLKSKESEGVHIDKKDFRLVDVIYDFSLRNKERLSTEYIDKVVKAKVSSSILTSLSDRLAELMFIGKYVPRKLIPENTKRMKDKLISTVKSFEDKEYKAMLNEESKMTGLMISRDEDIKTVAAKLLKVATGKKPNSTEERGLLEAIEHLSWEKEMKEFF